MPVREELTDFIQGLEVISTHEHHQEDAFYTEMSLKKVLANSYVAWCGVEPGATKPERKRFLEQVRHNTYFVWLEKALRELYDLQTPITAENWDELSGRIKQAYRDDPERHLRILRQTCNYTTDIQDSYDHPGSDRGHPDLFRPSFRINMFLYGYHPEAVDHNGNNPLVFYGKEPKSFQAYLEFVHECLEEALKDGCVALKSALAYDRSIAIGEPTLQEAARAWGTRPQDLTEAKKTAFGDYVFNHILAWAGQRDVPLQIHTGLAFLQGSDPLLLIPTLDRFRHLRFDLFHGGYPWTGVAGGLAHEYDSVWLDLCWLPLISTTAAVRSLAEWIDVTGSLDRILWGADTWTSEESYGALLAARYVVIEVLTSRIEAGMTDLDDACALARRIFHDNAAALFALR